MANLEDRDCGYPTKRLKTGQQVETVKPATYSAAYHEFKNARLDMDLGTLDSDRGTLGECKPDTDCPTELESALPHLDRGNEAAVDYEGMQPFEKEVNISRDRRGRLSTQKLLSGRRSIYVDAFNLALETVLDEESHLFDEKERKTFDEWRRLSYEAQYL
jgi:fanconi-associated nuclease 1